MSAIETFKASMEAANAKLAALRAEIMKETEASFTGLFAEFFEAFPEVRTIHFVQYTPYWNDGDECVFSLGEIGFSPKEYHEVDGHYDDDNLHPHTYGPPPEYQRIRNPLVSEALEAAMNGMKGVINDMEDYLKERFGDHKYIQVHHDGVEVEEYSHD